MHIGKIVLCFTLVCLSQTAFAKWDESINSTAGEWGKSASEFGIFHGDSSDFFPKNLLIDRENRIFILDIINKRLRICESNGCSNITPKSLPNGLERRSWPYEGNLAIANDRIIETRNDQIYDFQGNLIGVYNVGKKYYRGQDLDENLYFEDEVSARFYKYSPTGELLATYDEKPLELGVKSARRRAESDSKYDTTVQYKDITYHMILDEDWDDFVRDRNDHLYFFNSYTAKDPVSGEDSTTSLVVKYDSCGKLIDRLDLPISEYEKPTQAELDMPTTTLRVRNEYGPPVIGPDGSVYAWKRTPTTYSILKWTWVDSPDDPKGGPDAPTALKVAPATTGLYLTWTASPQDPGCVEGYEAERSSTSGGIFSNITTTAPGVVSYSDTGVLPGSSAYYRVRAKSSCGPSDYTAVIGGTRP